jgi:outer membrane protein OmpA-like peptidoglycan-associated protein
MPGLSKAVAAGLIAGLLSSCAWIEIADVERQRNQGTAFDRGLYDGYLQLARDEYDEADFVDEHRFADRARMAAAGTPPEPETLSFRDLSDADMAPLSVVRGRLTSAFGDGAKEKAPQDAAAAQVAFDCWMEQAEDGDADDAATCQQAFEDAMGRVQVALTPPPAPEPPALPEPSTILFGYNSDALSPESQSVLDNVAAQWEGAQANWLVISGYADASGNAEYNMKLSERRADAAALYLMTSGFPARNISIRTHGEDDLAVSTPDGTAEDANRRVVLSFER